jgi:hypothetical protein
LPNVESTNEVINDKTSQGRLRHSLREDGRILLSCRRSRYESVVMQKSSVMIDRNPTLSLYSCRLQYKELLFIILIRVQEKVAMTKAVDFLQGTLYDGG